ncbi:spore coat associated protein CotJA [Gracilibacillus sp. YIM 98692]|uniref:spore coat associated protein CotJA n=1 Tax=Gracilibacillus sp. YIM 98692 TaxID=2663532 RepID=UPI0013D62CC1|nr:spore coat associated protein CotJA [Gracilibacillus sp. YIM 98692]
MTYTPFKTYYPYVSPFDPCPPIYKKTYSTPPNLYIPFQGYQSEQFTSPKEALYKGTLWVCLYDPYPHRRDDA